MNKDTNHTERQTAITPFTYGDRAVRAVLIHDEPWFIARDVCDILELTNHRKAVSDLPENEKGVTTGYTPGGKQEMLTVNEPGLYRLIFQSRKPEAEKFKTWVFANVLPEIRKAGSYGPARGGIDAGEIYSLFSGDPSMTIRRINKFIYYQAVQPPLSGGDIARLLEANPSNVSYWRKWVPAETARAAVKKLGLTATGGSENAPSHHRPGGKAPPLERPGFPLALPMGEARHEAE